MEEMNESESPTLTGEVMRLIKERPDAQKILEEFRSDLSSIISQRTSPSPANYEQYIDAVKLPEYFSSKTPWKKPEGSGI